QMTFAESKERITRTLTDQKAEELLTKVRDAAQKTMKADFDAFKAAAPGGATSKPVTNAPASSLGVPFNSKDYLGKLRDKIQADFKVTLTIEREEGWKTPNELEESKLGKEGFNTGETTMTSFPRFLGSRVAAFLSEEQRKALESRGADVRPVAVWEPTPVFHNAVEDSLIARVTAADAAHVPASLDEVKDKVAADVKLAAAYGMAKKEAQAALDAAKSGKWLANVAADKGRKVMTTGLFSPSPGGMGPLPISGYDLKGQALATFTEGAFKLLTQPARSGGQAPRPPSTTQASATTKPAATTAPTQPVVASFKDHPIGLIEIPTDARVVVAEVDQIKPEWTRDRQAYFDARVALEAQTQAEQAMRFMWFNYDNLVSRVSFTPAQTRQRRSPGQNQQNVPINPFTGTILP
ncbi:MAG TPA: hypothetical protein VH475_07090, partial [Tepidisphaeraceae bacterium]